MLGKWENSPEAVNRGNRSVQQCISWSQGGRSEGLLAHSSTFMLCSTGKYWTDKWKTAVFMTSIFPGNATDFGFGYCKWKRRYKQGEQCLNWLSEWCPNSKHDSPHLKPQVFQRPNSNIMFGGLWLSHWCAWTKYSDHIFSVPVRINQK